MIDNGVSVQLGANVEAFVSFIRRIQLSMCEAFGAMIVNPMLYRAVRNGRRLDVQRRFETMSRKRRRKANRMADKRRGFWGVRRKWKPDA